MAAVAGLSAEFKPKQREDIISQTSTDIIFSPRVTRLRLLGEQVHSTRKAFVEFATAESAIVALNCSGMVLGTQPIRVSHSKTPIRPRITRLTTN